MKVKIKHNIEFDYLELGYKSHAKDFRAAYNEKFKCWADFGFKDKELVYIKIDGISEISPELFDKNKDAKANPLFVAFKNWQSKHVTFK